MCVYSLLNCFFLLAFFFLFRNEFRRAYDRLSNWSENFLVVFLDKSWTRSWNFRILLHFLSLFFFLRGRRTLVLRSFNRSLRKVLLELAPVSFELTQLFASLIFCFFCRFVLQIGFVDWFFSNCRLRRV